MKHKNYLVLSAVFLAFGQIAVAQTEKQLNEDRERQELRRKFQQGMQAHKIHRAQAMRVAVETNRYNHHEEEILDKLNVMSIPEDFPVYKAEYTDAEYVVLTNKWYAAHPELLRNSKAAKLNEQK